LSGKIRGGTGSFFIPVLYNFLKMSVFSSLSFSGNSIFDPVKFDPVKKELNNRMKKTIVCLTAVFLFAAAGCSCSPPARGVRIMTYNIRNGIGMDDVRDIDRVAGVIKKENPDIVALQEIDSVTHRVAGAFILEELSTRCGLFYTYASALPFDGGKYGIGLLSKERPVSEETVALFGREEERVLQVTEFEHYAVYHTHFSLTKEDRLASVEIVLNKAKESRKPVFFVGDLNCEYLSDEQERVRTAFAVLNDPLQNTFPADNPGVCIDFIYGQRAYMDAQSVVSRRVVENGVASDHRPVVVEVRF
jgi:endonuclease/exonuclease/phosphatase family metal-dependent hydrolase